MLIFIGSDVAGRSLPFAYLQNVLKFQPLTLQPKQGSNHSLPFQSASNK